MKSNDMKKTIYANNVGGIMFLVKNDYVGTKTISDAFDEIIVNAFRDKKGISEVETTDLDYRWYSSE